MPILYAIAAIGAVVLTSILTLLLTVIILESRHDFAVMRALGLPERFLVGGRSRAGIRPFHCRHRSAILACSLRSLRSSNSYHRR